MDRTIDEILAQVGEEVFETLAFMFPMDEDELENDAASVGLEMTVRVDFSGPLSGALYLTTSLAMLREFSASMLGMDGDAQACEDAGLDAFKELANVVCGNLLPTIAGRYAVFNVHAPEAVADSLSATAEKLPAAQVHLALDEGCVDMALFLDE